MREITSRRREKIERVLKFRQRDLTLVLANIHDPHNVSAIYRSCDAFGIEKVHLYYTDNVFPKLARKTSASARKWVDTVRHDNLESLKEALQGYQLLATDFTEDAKPMGEYDYAKPTAIIMGNEHKGIPEDLLAIADGLVYINMYGMIQSFNVSVASAILLSEANRQRVNAGMYDVQSLTSEEYNTKLASWIEK